MLRRAGHVLVALSLASALTLCVQPTTAQSDGRVFLISFDALGYERLRTDPVAQELTSLQPLLETGAFADGLTPAYPSTTANGHAALWTGTYAGHNGILYNSTPPFPRAEHTFTERIVGFRSDALLAEPIWLTAARQRVPVVAHQVTQAIPFLAQTVGAAPTPLLTVVNGFQSRAFSRWRAIRSSDTDVKRVACDGWTSAVPRDAVCYQWQVATDPVEIPLHAAVLDDRMRIAATPGGASVEVRRYPTETESPRRRPLGRRWSAPLAIQLPDALPASVVFRAFEIDPRTRSFLLLQTPLSETAIFSDEPGLAKELVAATGPMFGNGAGNLYSSGALGAHAASGGTGEAERRYLETMEMVVKQQTAQSAWLFRRRQPRLHISYISTIDEADHNWYGLDRSGDRRYTAFRRWAYVAADVAARQFLSLATSRDHVVITSDHGMAAVTRLFAVDRVLAEAGLSNVASRVDTCLLLNTTEWKGGTIAPEGRDRAVAQVRTALLAPRTPSGDPIVTKIYASKEEMASFGHDGPGGADLCFDLAPGVGLESSLKADLLVDAKPPRGSHGFDPTRPEMKAVLLIKGPRAEPGRNLGSLRSGAVAPLTADLLGIERPRDATFSSPLGRSPQK